MRCGIKRLTLVARDGRGLARRLLSRGCGRTGEMGMFREKVAPKIRSSRECGIEESENSPKDWKF